VFHAAGGDEKRPAKCGSKSIRILPLKGSVPG
jgi:hypothetical protein